MCLSARPFVRPSVGPYFHFRMITCVNANGRVSPQFDITVYIDIVKIWFGIDNGPISSVIDRVISPDTIMAEDYRFMLLFGMEKVNPLRKHAYSNILKFLPPKKK